MTLNSLRPKPVAKILLAASSKGGSGKTTVAALAAIGLSGRCKVALVDADAQGAATAWLAAGKGRHGSTVDVYSLATARRQLPSQLEPLAKAYDVIVIDLPPSLAEEAPMASMLVADAVLIPLRASPNDLRATGDTLAMVKVAKRTNPALRHFLMVNAFRNTTVMANVLHLLEEIGEPLMSAKLGDRTAFQLSSAFGTAPSELGSAHRVAADETRRLVDEIYSELFGAQQ